jgi:hypothetical protein
MDGLGTSKKLENLNFAAAADMAFDAGPGLTENGKMCISHVQAY